MIYDCCHNRVIHTIHDTKVSAMIPIHEIDDL